MARYIIYATTPGRKTLHEVYSIKASGIHNIPSLIDDALKGNIRNAVQVKQFPCLPLLNGMWVTRINPDDTYGLQQWWRVDTSDNNTKFIIQARGPK